MEIRNVSSWKLNNTELKELKERSENGEDEKSVKREIQTRKAVACEERKKSAAAIASKSTGEGSAVAKATKNKKADVSRVDSKGVSPDPTNAAYYAEVEADLKTILKEFPGLDKAEPLPLTEQETDGLKTGVQEPFNLAKAKHALEIHGVYRCSIPLFWLHTLASPTPGIPMSRRRVLDMSEFYFPDGKPAFMTGRMVEVAVSKNSLTDSPENLQMISPEEIVHSLVAACAHAIRSPG